MITITRKFGWKSGVPLADLETPPPTCPSNAWNPRKWTNRQTHSRNKTSFRSIQDDGTVSHLTSYPTFLESTRKNKSNFNMFPLFHPFHASSWDNWVKKQKSKELLGKTHHKQRVFPTQPPRALIFTGKVPDLRGQLVQSFAQLISIFLRSWLTRHLDSGWLAPTELKVKVVVTPSCCSTVFFCFLW